MDNYEMADALDEVADHLIVAGSEGSAQGYRKGAQQLRSIPHLPPNPADVQFIGDTIREAIVQMDRTGSLDRLDELREQYPYVQNLTQLEGVGPKTAKKLHEELGATYVCDPFELGDEMTQVSGIGATKSDTIYDAARRVYSSHTDDTELTEYTRAMAILEELQDEYFAETELHPCGTLAQQRAVTTIEIVVTAGPSYPDFDKSSFDPLIADMDTLLIHINNRFSGVLNDNVININVVHENELGARLLFKNSPMGYYADLRDAADERGYYLNRHGLWKSSSKDTKLTADRREIHEYLDKEWTPPQNRILRL